MPEAIPNGHVSPADVATLSLIGHGYGGHGYGHGYGGHGGYGGYGHGGYGHGGAAYLAAESSANGTAVNAKIEANKQAVDAQSAMFSQAEQNRQFGELKDSNSEERLSTQSSLNQLNQAIAGNAAEAAKCCCETNLEATKNAADLKSEILAVETRTVTRELDRCERRLESSDSTQAIVAAIQAQGQMLAALLAQGNGHGHGRGVSA